MGLPTLSESSLETPFHIKPEVPFTDLQVEARLTVKINQHGSTSDNRYRDYDYTDDISLLLLVRSEQGVPGTHQS